MSSRITEGGACLTCVTKPEITFCLQFVLKD
jgi:hypothetical protein